MVPDRSCFWVLHIDINSLGLVSNIVFNISIVHVVTPKTLKSNLEGVPNILLGSVSTFNRPKGRLIPLSMRRAARRICA